MWWIMGRRWLCRRHHHRHRTVKKGIYRRNVESKQPNRHGDGDDNENDNEDREDRCTVKLEILGWIYRNGLDVVAIAYGYWTSIAEAHGTRVALLRVDDNR